jgi:hypothetical protein
MTRDGDFSGGDLRRSLRWNVYWLLIVAAAAATSGRIASAVGRDGTTPFLSANDRSRWAMIHALVDHGTFAIDDVIFDRATGGRIRGWHTIDLVRHRGRDGQEHYYSSKPVLMPTLMAGVYWVVRAVTGAGLYDQPFYVGRIVLWICNVPPLVLMWWLLARVIDRYGRSDWGRLLAMTAATFGTFLSTFSITLNNHLHAAVAVTITVYALLRIMNDARRQPRYFLLAGLFAALTFANELPALAFLLGVGLFAWLSDWRRTLLLFVPAAAVVVVAMATLNYAAHGSLRPPYAHRHDGPIVAVLEVPAERVAALDAAAVAAPLNEHLETPVSPEAMIEPRLQVNPGQDITGRYMLWDESTQQRFALNILDGATAEGDRLEVRQWDNWYEYPGTYWTAELKRGVDRGEPSKLVYAFHCLVGHHGLFSLTPLWLIAFWGLTIAAGDRTHPLRTFALATLMLSAVCLTFYLFLSPLQDRNYGGWTNGLRWMMWFIPLYLVGLLPALERLRASRRGRAFALACLAVSIFSVWYNPMNPWQHPWLYDYWVSQGW